VFVRAAVSKYCKLGGLKAEKFINSQLWRLEVQGQGVSRVGSL
jgi:hypothetical protein